MKRWSELSSDEKFIVERLPPPTRFLSKEKERHLFCPRCRHEEANGNLVNC